MMEDPKHKFSERDSYGYDSNVLLCHINKENDKEYKTTIIPKVLIKTVPREIHDHFGHFGIGKTYFLIKGYSYWPMMIKQTQTHVGICSLCRRERFKLIDTNFQQGRYLKEHLLKYPLTSLLKCLLHIMAIKYLSDG